MWSIKELGLLSADSYPGLDRKHPKFSSWPDFLASYLGDASGQTAMVKTVGQPLGIAAELILNNNIQSRGVIGPVLPENYEPLLKELKHRGVTFVETVV